jgi:hypothetical protein
MEFSIMTLCSCLLYSILLFGPTLALAGQQSLPDNGEETTIFVTIKKTTTYCPPGSTITTTTVVPTPVPYTRSTVYATSTYTVANCPSSVLHCPDNSISLVTETIPLYTTYCPVGTSLPTTVPTLSVTTPVPTVSITNPISSLPATTGSISIPWNSTLTASCATNACYQGEYMSTHLILTNN